MEPSTFNQSPAHVDEFVKGDGTSRRAQQAIKSAREAVNEADRATGSTPQQDLVKSLGFPSYERLLANSAPVSSSDGKSWFVTSLPDGSWVPWNESDFEPERHFSAKQEALASVPQSVGLPGSSLIG